MNHMWRLYAIDLTFSKQNLKYRIKSTGNLAYSGEKKREIRERRLKKEYRPLFICYKKCQNRLRFCWISLYDVKIAGTRFQVANQWKKNRKWLFLWSVDEQLLVFFCSALILWFLFLRHSFVSYTTASMSKETNNLLFVYLITIDRWNSSNVLNEYDSKRF